MNRNDRNKVERLNVSLKKYDLMPELSLDDSHGLSSIFMNNELKRQTIWVFS